MAAHEAQADVQKMIAWIERSDNPFIYGDNRIIVYDRDRELYSTPQLLLMQQKLADQLKFWVRPLEIPPELFNKNWKASKDFIPISARPLNTSGRRV